MTKPYRSSSQILLEIIQEEESGHQLTYQGILQALGSRAFGLALLFFALPSALPFSTIPGISVLFSLPLLVFSFQMICGRKWIWLPKFIGERTIPKEKAIKIIKAAIPYLTKLEKLLKSRWSFMFSRAAEIITGLIIFCLAAILMLPIPFSNFILATLVIILALGTSEEDGLFILIGYIGAGAYIAFLSGFIIIAFNTIFN